MWFSYFQMFICKLNKTFENLINLMLPVHIKYVLKHNIKLYLAYIKQYNFQIN